MCVSRGAFKLSVIGTDHLPAHLEFLNYPDSSILASFPNTPHESGENSASSGSSLADGDEPVTPKKPVMKQPVSPVTQKRRLYGRESQSPKVGSLC